MSFPYGKNLLTTGEIPYIGNKAVEEAINSTSKLNGLTDPLAELNLFRIFDLVYLCIKWIYTHDSQIRYNGTRSVGQQDVQNGRRIFYKEIMFR